MFLQIVGLTVVEANVTSRSVRVEWFLSDISGANLLEYQPSYTIASENHWVNLDWIKIPEMGYTFQGLYPFTR